MPNNYFISGMPKAGKTTLLRKLVEKMRGHGLKVGGFLSPEEKAHGTRTGFYVEDIESGRMERLAEEDIDGPKVAKYHVDIKSFESLAVPVLESARRYDVIIIDEIGRMEMKSARFAELLSQVLESDTPVVATISRDYMEAYSAWGEVQILTPSNRSRIYLTLLEKVMAYKKRVAARAKRKAKAPKKGAKGRAKPAKKGKNAKAKSRREREELDQMAEDLLRHKAKRKEERGEAAEHEKREERHPYHVKEEHHHGKEEKAEEGKHEHKGRKHHVREWIREHVGV